MRGNAEEVTLRPRLVTGGGGVSSSSSTLATSLGNRRPRDGVHFDVSLRLGPRGSARRRQRKSRSLRVMHSRRRTGSRDHSGLHRQSGTSAGGRSIRPLT